MKNRYSHLLELGSASASLLLLCGTSGIAQVPATPPADLLRRPFVQPTIMTKTLQNGLKVVLVETHNVPLVSFRLAAPGGSINEPTDQPGLATAVASQLTAGTKTLKSFELNVAAEQLGGSVGASANADYATVSASALSRNFNKIAGLLADVVQRPAFPDSELSVYKSLAQQGLVVQKQNPGFLAQKQLSKILFGDNPYSVVSTTAAATNALTRDKIESFYKAHYTPHNSTLVVVGDFKTATAFSEIEKAFGGWSGPESPAPSLPNLPSRESRKIYLINRPGSVQSNILFGNLSFKRDDPDYYPALVANTILGGGSGSRLFSNVREKQGFAYDVRSSVTSQGLAGTFTGSAQTRTAVTAAALKEMFKEADAIRTTPVTAAELQSAKNYLGGTFVLSLTSQSGLADRLLTQEVYHLPANYLASYRDKINAVTAEDVRRVAQKYFLFDSSAVVIVGDADKLRASLKEFGDVEEVAP